jgi:putative phosphoserine phosphatase / 1-acylglycerol-3-phosphate O-acyltransferase
MPALDERLRAIACAPEGPGVAAFFDYDGTVIDGYSASAFYRHRLRHGEIGPIELGRTLLAGVRGIHDFDAFLAMALKPWAGRRESDLVELGESLFKHDTASRLRWEVWALADAHRARGHRIVLASSATRFQVAPMARELAADDLLCSPVEAIGGVLTGRTGGPGLWGPGKARAVRTLAAEHELDLAQCFGYSDGAEDAGFLAAVGHPMCVDPDVGLAVVARKRGWPVLHCAPRGGHPGVLEIARTAGFYAALAGAFGAGIGLGVLNRSRETLIEITGGVGSDLGLALAGVDVQVVHGAEHLWSARPCVFMFNHQSKLDAIMMMKLLRSGFTGVTKKEAASVPGFGQFFRLAGVAFVDRGNAGRARAALAPAVQKIRRDGLSLVIAPEGTRSATPRVGPFKKGGFHIAMQAGVPIVPVVLRNVGEVMWRGSQTIRPGTVEVAVLDPVDTDDWTADELDHRVAEVRSRFVATLANWPSPSVPRLLEVGQ